MGLIEKAVGDIEARLAPPAAKEEGAAEPELFDLDFAALKAGGFYSPQDRDSRLSLELRAVRRALLRRTGLRNAHGDRRLIRKGGRQRNLVLVTSTQPGEGKTFCAVNLALSLALEEETEVLLVDADAPCPKIRSVFGLPERPGLTDRLADPGLAIAPLRLRARQAPLSVMPEGSVKGRATDLFASAEAQRFFTSLSLRNPGRLVILDAPPVLATPDAAVLARHVDEVVFVVEADSTPEPAVAAALDELLEANQNVSLLLNRCLIGEAGSYYGSYGDYGQKSAAAAAEGRNNSARGYEDERPVD